MSMMSCLGPITGYRPSPGAEDKSLRFNRRDGFGDLPITFNCGQCKNCRIRATSFMSTRAMAEAQMHPAGSCYFVNITYADEHLPLRGSVVKGHCQDYVRSLRRNGFPDLRYKIKAEYGERFGRPHYHMLAFSLPVDDLVYWGKSPQGDVLSTSATLDALWGKGRVLVGSLTFDSAGYVNDYMSKVSGRDAAEYLRRFDPESGEVWQVAPEFTLQSLKPGLGLSFFKKHEAEILSNGSVFLDGEHRGFPPYFARHADPVSLARLKASLRRKAVEAGELERVAHEAVNPDPFNSNSRLFQKHQIRERRVEARLRDGGGSL